MQSLSHFSKEKKSNLLPSRGKKRDAIQEKNDFLKEKKGAIFVHYGRRETTWSALTFSEGTTTWLGGEEPKRVAGKGGGNCFCVQPRGKKGGPLFK